jgi:nucleotide-binding universal stress UspA family protein
MLERILVPLDGSPRAEAILAHLRQLLLRKDSEVFLVRVIEPPLSLNARESAGLLEERRTEAKGYLQALKARLEDAGARVDARMGEGYPAEAILEAAKAVGASLIAMSSHGRSGIDRWAFGSVTEKVLRASDVPLLVVRFFAAGSGEAAPYRRILVPIDGSDHSLQVVQPAGELAALFGADVVLVHVVDPESPSAPMPQIERAQGILRELGVKAEVEVRQGDPATEILSVATQRSVDLIALASHGRTGMSRWVLGSVAEKLLRTSSLPTLVVRPGPLMKGR